MKTKLNTIKDYARNIGEQELITSTQNVIYCYERSTLDESDIYNLMRDVLAVVSNIYTLRNTIEEA